MAIDTRVLDWVDDLIVLPDYSPRGYYCGDCGHADSRHTITDGCHHQFWVAHQASYCDCHAFTAIRSYDV